MTKTKRIKLWHSVTCVVTVFILFVFCACQKDFDGNPFTKPLRFSTDTLFVDSLFSNISSPTRRFKVYNDDKDPILISQIYLGRQDSGYRINVDGNTGTYFTDTYLRGKDSLYVFVELTQENNTGNELTYKDSLVFESPYHKQDVKLIAQIFDAHFIYAESGSVQIDGDQTMDGGLRKIRELKDSELTLTNQKPYVFYDYIKVPANKTLTVEAGAKLYFHNQSALIVPEGSTLKINGTLEAPVLISGDQLKSEFNNIPGQWDGIWLQGGSINNTINYCQINSAVVGLRVEDHQTNNPSLSIHNTAILFSSNCNLNSSKARIDASNLILGNAINSSLKITNGGHYTFNHCTIANFKRSIYRTPLVSLSNEREDETHPLEVEFNNSILFQNNVLPNRLIDFLENESNTFSTLFHHCLINGETNNYIPSNADVIQNDNNVYSSKTDFFQPYSGDFRIGLESDAIGKADAIKSVEVPLDYIGSSRLLAPDIGSYQAVEKEMNEEEKE